MFIFSSCLPGVVPAATALNGGFWEFPVVGRLAHEDCGPFLILVARLVVGGADPDNSMICAAGRHAEDFSPGWHVAAHFGDLPGFEFHV